jgi:hypothetical protein
MRSTHLLRREEGTQHRAKWHKNGNDARSNVTKKGGGWGGLGENRQEKRNL